MRTQQIYTVIAASLGTITLAYIVYYINKRKRLQNLPKNANWIKVGTVQEIAMYPIRSTAAILLNEVQCKYDGLYWDDLKDRGLLIGDENGKFPFAGVYPKMLSLTTEKQEQNILLVKAPEMEALVVNLNLLKTKQMLVKYRQGCKIYLVEADDEHHRWISKVILNKFKGLKLYLIIKMELQYNLWGEETSEFIPVLVMHDKSIEDLNQRLTDENKINHLQFRGNVLIKSLENIKPYAEDNWKWLRFGDENCDNEKCCIIRYKAPCLRCILPNIDIKTYQRNRNFEPLRTLKKYRLIHDRKEPTMGAHYKVYQEGTIKATDTVYAIV